MWAVLASTVLLLSQKANAQMPVGDPAVDLMKAFASDLSDGNFGRVANSLAPNARVFWLDGSHSGNQAVARYFAGQAENYAAITMVLGNSEPATSPTVSAVWGDCIVTYQGQGTFPSSKYRGRYSAVARKIDKSWLLVSVHVSVPYPYDGVLEVGKPPQ